MPDVTEATSANPLTRLAILYCGRDPVGAAQAIEGLEPGVAVEVLEALTHAKLQKLLPHLSPSFVAALIDACSAERIAPLLERGGADVCSALLLSLADEHRTAFLQALPEELREHIAELLTFPTGSVGQAMKTDYTAFHEQLSVLEAIELLRQRQKGKRNVSNIFVVDAEQRLIGVVAMRDLVVASEDETLGDLMVREVVSVSPFDDESAALRTLSGRGFTTLPVVDAQNHLVGVVRATQLLADAQRSASRDVQKLFGVGRDERAFSPVAFCLKKRLPWLHINLATAFLAASVVALFEDVIARVTVLAVYLPVVAGQGGNAGAQSLAVVMRGLVMREIPMDRARSLLVKEGLIGLVNGLVLGVVTAAIAWLWNGNAFLGLVVGLAMIVNLTVAGLAGAVIPLMMKRFGLDPAQSSSIVLTTVTDVVGFFAFLGFAVLFESWLT
ncbi:MAG: magnesium transporter [Planctomycetes bacterium]|nr:magnesium transporter [Planctomycetota bacterium]